MNDSSLLQLLEHSHGYNLARNITGMLLYMESRFIVKLQGRFMHVIEGEETEVMKVYERISCDPRHQIPVILASGFQEKKHFNSWCMSFRPRDLVQPEHEAYQELQDKLFEQSLLKQKIQPYNYLRSFYDYNLELQNTDRYPLLQDYSDIELPLADSPPKLMMIS